MLTAMYTQTVRETLTTPEVARATGITYRQLDYWLRNKVIPHNWVDNAHEGSGSHRRWSPEAIAPLRVAGRISRALPTGTNLSSADMKKVLAHWDTGRLEFGDGITLTWTPE